MAEILIPESPTLERLREVAAGCKACHLWERGTQTVFGEGARNAEVMLVGEQPGDQEDRAGQPFVGPAGRVLDEALEQAGIDRSKAYVTNVVKHFKWEARGKRRIHARPNWTEIAACKPWLEAELAVVEPRVAGLPRRDRRAGAPRQAVPGDEAAGRAVESPLAPNVLATIHPSAILRQRDEGSRREEMAAFVDDLGVVAKLLR